MGPKLRHHHLVRTEQSLWISHAGERNRPTGPVTGWGCGTELTRRVQPVLPTIPGLRPGVPSPCPWGRGAKAEASGPTGVCSGHGPQPPPRARRPLTSGARARSRTTIKQREAPRESRPKPQPSRGSPSRFVHMGNAHASAGSGRNRRTPVSEDPGTVWRTGGRNLRSDDSGR